MKDLERKKKRLRLAVLAAASLGCSSATMSGTLAMLSLSAGPPAVLMPAALA